jgi:hypothetical protein
MHIKLPATTPKSPKEVKYSVVRFMAIANTPVMMYALTYGYLLFAENMYEKFD